MAKKKLAPVTPPDPKQCQAECLEGSFMTFGPRNVIRCTRPATWIAKERKPGPDGRKGSMSLCDQCSEMMQVVKGKDFATLTAVKSVKSVKAKR